MSHSTDRSSEPVPPRRKHPAVSGTNGTPDAGQEKGLMMSGETVMNPGVVVAGHVDLSLVGNAAVLLVFSGTSSEDRPSVLSSYIADSEADIKH